VDTPGIATGIEFLIGDVLSCRSNCFGRNRDGIQEECGHLNSWWLAGEGFWGTLVMKVRIVLPPATAFCQGKYCGGCFENVLGHVAMIQHPNLAAS
jgi:hypothetical protein